MALIQPLSSTLLSSFTIFILLHLLIATTSGVKVNLIPRDSPSSPFYNPSKTHFDRLHDAFERSSKRVNHFKSSILLSSSSPQDESNKIQTQISPGGGEFLMNISIGTPPIQILGIADTGSDLIWTQCLPCRQCFEQDLPLFDPHKSSTYNRLTCQSERCQELDRPPQCGYGENKTCLYTYSYGDGSHTTGDLSSETFTMGIEENNISLKNIVFGCGHVNGGRFGRSQSGLIGLGGGTLSFVSQLDESLGKKFSYCLVPLTPSRWSNTSSNVSSAGIISFGDDAAVAGEGLATTTTPMVDRDPSTFYYLTLEAISVGNERVPYKGRTEAVLENNIIIDSGTPITYLPMEFYDSIEKAVVKAVNETRVDDPDDIFKLCYNYNNVSMIDNNSTSGIFPVLTAHFDGGDVELQAVNTFVQVDEDLICFSFAPSSQIAIFGNLAQINFLVGYDLEARTVSFLPKDCSQQ